jgi:predicted flap endonuclease-1-like 5' DNA nuclease
MLFTTSEQFVVLAIVLLSGWLIGFASAPSAAKVRRRARAQADSFAAYRRDADDKLRAAQQRSADLKDELATLRADHADAEQTIARLRAGGAARDDNEAVVAPTPVAAAPTEVSIATPASELPAAPRAWPAGTARDDLTRLRGIDGLMATRLFSLGVLRFEDIAKLSAEDEMALEQRLALPAGYIAREQWRAQATSLRAGVEETPTDRFAAVPAKGAADSAPPPA